ncbi:MAG: hypothetical protein MJ189_02625 [Coriobacteriales bacterium]|nr:hypothetical protein [Coriobacteriales bacterium]
MEFVGTWWALLPPVIAIVLALITKKTYLSLFAGVFVGALLLAQFDPVATINNIILSNAGTEEEPLAVGFIGVISDPWNAGIYLFLIMLGFIVALVNASGGSAAFGRWAAKHVHSRVGVQLATVFFSYLIFIDDYFACLTVGSVMRTVTDSKNVSRAKLSYIIDATAAPICIISPISSWAAAVSATASSLDTGVTGIQLFISSIPYNFYSLFTIIFVLALVFFRFDYGPMAKSELAAYKEGKLGSLGNEDTIEDEKARVFDMIIPIVVLIASCIVGMLYIGGFWDAEMITDAGEATYMNLAVAFGTTDASVGLPWGCLIALAIIIIYLLARRRVNLKGLTDCLIKGFEAMIPALLILTFALCLKSLTSALGADVFIAGLMEGAAAELYMMLPAIIFLVGLGLGFATGTSWGTFGILIPIVVSIFTTEPVLLTIGISACLAGAVCGDHCSPISDTTIMASAGANVDHIEHVSTQLPYALTVAAISFVTYIIAGFTQNVILCLAIGAVLTIATLIILKKTVGVSVEERKVSTNENAN